MSSQDSKIVDAMRASLLETERLRRENGKLRAALVEPMAVVGMACRFPGGAGSPEELWELVAEGVDAIGAFPVDRGWSSALFDPDSGSPGTTQVDEGGFLGDVAGFGGGRVWLRPREGLGRDLERGAVRVRS